MVSTQMPVHSMLRPHKHRDTYYTLRFCIEITASPTGRQGARQDAYRQPPLQCCSRAQQKLARLYGWDHAYFVVFSTSTGPQASVKCHNGLPCCLSVVCCRNNWFKGPIASRAWTFTLLSPGKDSCRGCRGSSKHAVHTELQSSSCAVHTKAACTSLYITGLAMFAVVQAAGQPVQWQCIHLELQ